MSGGHHLVPKVVAGGAFAGALWAAPWLLLAPGAHDGRAHSGRPLRGADAVDQVAAQALASGASGWELVDVATQLVNRRYAHYSTWHLWDPPARSLAHGHGQSTQYNLALAQVLRRLGFEVTPVHAARVRSASHNPWFHAGHFWLRVRWGGHERDVCAGSAANRAGAVHFHPVTEVRPARRATPVFIASALWPFVARDVWTQVLQRRPAAPWVYRDFGTAA